MYASLPALSNTNCCQPKHSDGYIAPLHVEVAKKFELSWSEKMLACVVPVYGLIPVSLVTPVTLSKDPTAIDILNGVSAETSAPLPTMAGLGPRAGINGIAGAVVHGTSRHTLLG